MGNKGQSLVELTISFLVLMFLLVGAFEFGLAFTQYVQLRDAAQEGALYGSMNPNDTVSIESRIRGTSDSPLNLYNPSVQILISYDTQPCEGQGIKVTILYPHKIIMPFLPKMLGQDYILLRAEVTNTILSPVCQ